MASTGTGTYTVKHRDTWQSIATKYGVSAGDLARYNRNVARPTAGTVVKIPRPYSPFKPSQGVKPQVAQMGTQTPPPPVPSFNNPVYGGRKYETETKNRSNTGMVVGQNFTMPQGIPYPTGEGFVPVATSPGNPSNWDMKAAVDNPANPQLIQYWNKWTGQWGEPVRFGHRSEWDIEPQRPYDRPRAESGGPKPPGSRPEEGATPPGHRQTSPGLPDNAAYNSGGGYTIPVKPPKQFWSGPRLVIGGGTTASGRYYNPEFPGLVGWRI